jgi:hypothetical protein
VDSIRTVGTREPREHGVVNWLFAMGSSRVFQRYVCEFEMLKSRTNDEMKAERSSYSTDYDWLKRADGFQDSLIGSHQTHFTTALVWFSQGTLAHVPAPAGVFSLLVAHKGDGPLF